MRILYGVVGEGMGHAMRSRVILDELVKSHEVQVVVSGRAYDYLQARASENLASRRSGATRLVYEDNEVAELQDRCCENLKGAVTGWPENMRAYFEIAEQVRARRRDLRLRELELPVRASATGCR